MRPGRYKYCALFGTAKSDPSPPEGSTRHEAGNHAAGLHQNSTDIGGSPGRVLPILECPSLEAAFTRLPLTDCAKHACASPIAPPQRPSAPPSAGRRERQTTVCRRLGSASSSTRAVRRQGGTMRQGLCGARLTVPVCVPLFTSPFRGHCSEPRILEQSQVSPAYLSLCRQQVQASTSPVMLNSVRLL